MLGMPYKYAIPIQGITAALHWCISQSIIPVQVTYLPTDGGVQFSDTLDLAFSPLAIIASLCMAGILLIAVLAFGLRRLTPPMPLASSCSLALSAAAHPMAHPVDLDTAYKPEGEGHGVMMRMRLDISRSRPRRSLRRSSKVATIGDLAAGYD